MKSRIPVLEMLPAAAGIAALTFFGMHQERRETPVTEWYSSYNAGAEGYRAWYELLQREGLRVDRYERYWAFLDHATGTLIAASPADLHAASPSGANGEAALLAWIRGGGRLVVCGPSSVLRSRDGLLPKLAYHRLSPEELSRMGVRGVGGTGSPTIERALLGHGEIIVVPDAALFSNKRIGLGDTARLAYALGTQVAPDASERRLDGPDIGGKAVAFDETLHGHVIPEHWWQAAPRRLTAAILGACAVAFIALLGAAIRLGPPIIPPRRREVGSCEYLDAVAGLYARARARREILQDLAGVTHHLERTPALISPEMHAAVKELRELADAAHPEDTTLLRAASLAYAVRTQTRQGE